MKSRKARVSQPARQDPCSELDREAVAANLPFILRAWWMREFEEAADLSFGDHSFQTLPLHCLHSDPICDAGNMDVALI